MTLAQRPRSYGATLNTRVLRAAHRALTAVSGPGQADVEQRDLAIYDALCAGETGQGVA